MTIETDRGSKGRGRTRPARPGALVVSLDFELHWGLRDHVRPGSPYMRNILGARDAVPALLDTFKQHDIAATWAVVGLLFAATRDEQLRFRPGTLPAYGAPDDAPYGEAVGTDETEDPVHFARSLVDLIMATPYQEIGSHTLSHYYCLQTGNSRESFKADLTSAQALAAEIGAHPRSLVFPRNQVNEVYLPVVLETGFTVYRGPSRDIAHRPHGTIHGPLLVRALRLLDSYVPLIPTTYGNWADLHGPAGLVNIPGSRFLRPYSPRLRSLEPLRLRRLTRELDHAAETGRVFHLWWHPHNFGADLDANLKFLHNILDHFAVLRSRFGMTSLTMGEAADVALEMDRTGSA